MNEEEYDITQEELEEGMNIRREHQLDDERLLFESMNEEEVQYWNEHKLDNLIYN